MFVRGISTAVLLAALAVPSAGVQAAKGDDGDLVVLDGGSAQVTLIGLLQLQEVITFGDDTLRSNGDAADETGFRLRRARFGVGGVAWGLVDFELSLEAAAESARLLDAWLAWRPLTSLSVSLGAKKVPFSRFAMTGAGKGALNQRPLGVTAMAPFRQVGLTVDGEVGGGLFHWALGVYNGFARNSSFYEGYVESSGFDGNRFTNLAYAGRVELAPLGPMGDGFADFDRGGLRLGLGGSLYFDPGETVESLGWQVDALLKVEGFHLALEFIADNATPSDEPTTSTTLPTELSRMAFIGEAGYMILAESLGITVRAELLDANTDLDDADDSLVITGGLQWYERRHHFKLGLEFTHREELEGLSLDNDSLTLQAQFQL